MLLQRLTAVAVHADSFLNDVVVAVLTKNIVAPFIPGCCNLETCSCTCFVAFQRLADS